MLSLGYQNSGTSKRCSNLCAAVAVFKTCNVVLVKITEGYLKKNRSFWTARDAVFGVTRAEKGAAFMRLIFFVADVYDAGALEYAPEFIAVTMGLKTDRFASIDGYYLDGCLFIEREAFEVPPWAIFFLIVREIFHVTSIQCLFTDKLKVWENSASMRWCAVSRDSSVGRAAPW